MKKKLFIQSLLLNLKFIDKPKSKLQVVSKIGSILSLIKNDPACFSQTNQSPNSNAHAQSESYVPQSQIQSDICQIGHSRHNLFLWYEF